MLFSPPLLMINVNVLFSLSLSEFCMLIQGGTLLYLCDTWSHLFVRYTPWHTWVQIIILLSTMYSGHVKTTGNITLKKVYRMGSKSLNETHIEEIKSQVETLLCVLAQVTQRPFTYVCRYIQVYSWLRYLENEGIWNFSDKRDKL